LDADFTYDLKWFRAFLEKAVNPFTMLPEERPCFTICCDASLAAGGAILDDKEAYSAGFDALALAFAHDLACANCAECASFPVLSHVGCSICISVLELLNCVAALHMWSHILRGARVKFLCDNMPAVLSLNSGKSRSKNMARVLKNAHLFAAYSDIEITAQHIPGVSMVYADALSRRGTHPRFDNLVSELFASGVKEVFPSPSLFHLEFAITTPPGVSPY
jgi:hypothetical protein